MVLPTFVWVAAGFSPRNLRTLKGAATTAFEVFTVELIYRYDKLIPLFRMSQGPCCFFKKRSIYSLHEFQKEICKVLPA